MNEIKYLKVGETSYYSETSQQVIDALENIREKDIRVRIFYGDIKTGRSWLDENDTDGYVGRSTGTVKIPLLIHNSRSMGGGAILDHCIIRIIDTKTHRVLYTNPKFHTSKLTIKECKLPRENVDGKMTFYHAEVYVNGSIHARFTTMEKAEKWVKRMQG